MKKFKIGQVWQTGMSIGVVTSINKNPSKYSPDAELIAVVNDSIYTVPQVRNFCGKMSVYVINLYSFEFKNRDEQYVPKLVKTMSIVEYSDFLSNVMTSPGVKPKIQQMEA